MYSRSFTAGEILRLGKLKQFAQYKLLIFDQCIDKFQAKEQSYTFQPRIPQVSMLLQILYFFLFLFPLLNAIFYLKKCWQEKQYLPRKSLLNVKKNAIHHSMYGRIFLTFELQILQSIAPQNISKHCVPLLWRGSYSWCSVFDIFLKESPFCFTEIFEAHSNEKYLFYYFGVFIHCAFFFFNG